MKLHNFDFSKKIFFHPENIVRYKNGERPFPITVEIDLTNKCNHKCTFCFYKEKLSTSRATLETDLVINSLKKMRELGTKGSASQGAANRPCTRIFRALFRMPKNSVSTWAASLTAPTLSVNTMTHTSRAFNGFVFPWVAATAKLIRLFRAWTTSIVYLGIFLI